MLLFHSPFSTLMDLSQFSRFLIHLKFKIKNHYTIMQQYKELDLQEDDMLLINLPIMFFLKLFLHIKH